MSPEASGLVKYNNAEDLDFWKFQLVADKENRDNKARFKKNLNKFCATFNMMSYIVAPTEKLSTFTAQPAFIITMRLKVSV